MTSRPFERIPQHAGDPGFGPVPPESKVRNLVDVPEQDELSRHLEGEHHSIRAQEIDSPMNACSLKETCQWVKRIALQRPPSGEMVMVPRELTPAMHEAGLRFAGTLHANYEDCWKALLSAASGANFVLRVSPEKLKEIQDEFTSRIIQPEVKP